MPPAGVFELQGDDSFIAAQPRSVACGKISKKGSLPLTLDHRIDIVVGRFGNTDTRVRVLANRGITSDLFSVFEFAVSPTIAERPNPRGVAIWDMNKDGFPDVLTANVGSQSDGIDASEGFSVLRSKTD